MKIRVQRLVKVWVEETYDVKELSDQTLTDIIDYGQETDDVETLWETQSDLGPVDIYTNDRKTLLYSNHHE